MIKPAKVSKFYIDRRGQIIERKTGAVVGSKGKVGPTSVSGSTGKEKQPKPDEVNP